jgi:agmatine/peptidylarginine deiminase
MLKSSKILHSSFFIINLENYLCTKTIRKMAEIILPSEWHKQIAVQLTFPHAETDWCDMLEEVEECFFNIAKEIACRELLLIVAPDVKSVKEKLLAKGVKMENIRFFACQTNDTWARDHGGITVFKDGKPVILDFKFNGWGLKFAANYDNLITSKIFAHPSSQKVGEFSETMQFPLFGGIKGCGTYENHLNFVLEGGGIESDGKGTLMTTSECLLSPNRNGGWDKEQIEDYLKKVFGLKRVLWVNNGFLEGDDTDSHIDTLARFCPDDTIVYVKCTDKNDVHFEALQAMENELKSFKTLQGKPYRLLPLPMADPVIFDGERLPATYANFLIINGAVLYPTYNQPENDKKAAGVLAVAFPEREIIGVDCSALIKQHGSLHCVTMQFPELLINY